MQEPLSPSQIVIGLNAVTVAVTRDTPRLLVVPREAGSANAHGQVAVVDALPFGPLDAERDRTLELALRRWVREQTGVEVGYVEQLYTFGDRHREPAERRGGPRVISISYLALVRESRLGRDARWRGWYDYFPWEDWRRGRPAILEQRLAPALQGWAESAERPEFRRARRERIDIAFGLRGAPWDGERVLDRYELLYEAMLVAEALRDGGHSDAALPETSAPLSLGRPMHADHRRILATALGRLRGKIRYRPVVFELVPPTFTLFGLQRVVEALSGVPLHKQNFRRLVEKGGLVEGTGQLEAGTVGRPAELFRFRREVLRERPAPGVGLPGLPSS